jgi:branched-chain amino acid aminotransferase
VGEIADGDRSVQVGGGEAGEVSRTLLRALADLRAGRAPDPHGWLVRV